jgi:hypothetical protein
MYEVGLVSRPLYETCQFLVVEDGVLIEWQPQTKCLLQQEPCVMVMQSLEFLLSEVGLLS